VKLIEDSIAEGRFVSPLPYVLKSPQDKTKPEDVSRMLMNPVTILVERLTGQLSQLVSRKGSKLVIQITLHNVTLLRSGKQVPESYLSSQVRDHYVYLDLDIPSDMALEERSGMIMYNMIRTENGNGKTLYRTPKKADASIVHNRTCSLWVRKNGFVITNQDELLDMDTEKELAELAGEESVGSFQETEISAWTKFDLNNLKESNSLFADEPASSNNMNSLFNGVNSEEERESDIDEDEDEVMNEVQDDAHKEDEDGGELFCKPSKDGEAESSEGEEVGLSDAESTGSLWDDFATLIPMARDLVQKLPIQSRTERSNDRDWDDSSSEEVSSESEKEEGDAEEEEEEEEDGAKSESEEEEEVFCESVDLWKQVTPLTPPLEEVIEISGREPAKPPVPKTFVLPNFLNGLSFKKLPKFTKRPKKEIVQSTEYADDDEVEVIAPPSKKPKPAEVITLSDDEEDVPLAKRKPSESLIIKKRESSSSDSKPPPAPATKLKKEPGPKPDPRKVSKPPPPPPPVTTNGTHKPLSRPPPTHPRSSSPLRANKSVSPVVRQQKPASTSESRPRSSPSRPPVTLQSLEKIYGSRKLEDAIDMISFIRAREEHNEQRVNHLHHILHHNFDIQPNRFQWTKNDRRLFDADPKLKNPHTRARLTAIYEPKVLEHRQRYLKYKQRFPH
jgi:hypothetical protein